MKTALFFLFIFFLFSCEKSEYETYLTMPGIDAIDSVAIYPNSPVLIADGKARLELMVKVYSKVTSRRVIEQVINGEHVIKDSVFTKWSEMKLDRLPADQIHIETADGQKVINYLFSTEKGGGTDIEFVGTVNQVKSAPCRIHAIARPEMNFGQIMIPVVFHLLYTKENTTKYDGVTTEMLQGFLDRANRVFAGTYANDPVAVDCKIQFKLATEDADGNPLEIPGMNKVDLGDPGYGDVADYIAENLLWNPNKILNVWVNDEMYDNEANGPVYVLDNGTTLSGFELTPVASADEAEFSSYDEAGIAISINSIFSMNKAGSGNSDHFEFYLGSYFGLLPTVYSKYSDIEFIDGDVDFCSDTYTYILGPISRQKSTYSDDEAAPKIYYNSYNIMDESSASTSLTYEQAMRIRTVIANCPGRMFK